MWCTALFGSLLSLASDDQYQGEVLPSVFVPLVTWPYLTH
jgi:hypothetical protein